MVAIDADCATTLAIRSGASRAGPTQHLEEIRRIFARDGHRRNGKALRRQRERGRARSPRMISRSSVGVRDDRASRAQRTGHRHARTAQAQEGNVQSARQLQAGRRYGPRSDDATAARGHVAARASFSAGAGARSTRAWGAAAAVRSARRGTRRVPRPRARATPRTVATSR